MQDFVVEVNVVVTVSIPDEIEATKEKVRDLAMSCIEQRCEVDCGSTGNIVWAELFAETSEDDCEIVEGFEEEEEPTP